jgi:hypothetical protein
MTAAIETVLPGVPHVESPLFERIFEQKHVSPETLAVARQLRRDGYAVIDFPDPDFDRTAATIIESLNSRYDWDGWRNGTRRDMRVQDAWRFLPEVKSLACNATILQLLSDLYGRRAFPFQTLNFPVGTQQHFHSDSVHFSSCPERFMAGVWVALEDIDSDNGPLIYYPGSHALPVFTNEHVGIVPDGGPANPYTKYSSYERAWEAIVDSLDMKPLQFHAKKGQALIWAANLLHGGAAQLDLSRTRYSQVSHYYFEGCSYYTPLLSVPFLGKIHLRDIIDVSTGALVPNTLNGEEVRPATPQSVPPGFDGAAYLNANPDVKAAGVDPALHWLEFGYKESRPLK